VSLGGWLAAGAGLLGLGLAFGTRPGAGSAGLVRALPKHAKQYAGAIERAATAHGLEPLLLAAVLEQESDFGEGLTPKGPGGKGDKGHGHGVGQIDDRSWGAWLATHAWWDFETNATKSAEILAAGLRTFNGNFRAGVSAYNAGAGAVRRALKAGKDAGTVTTHSAKTKESYPDGIARRLARLQQRATT
jgi:soluble lytic murein transglycosylase-like protein